MLLALTVVPDQQRNKQDHTVAALKLNVML
jgi:hypothetical protein